MLHGGGRGNEQRKSPFLFPAAKEKFSVKMFRLYLHTCKYSPIMDEGIQGRGETQHDNYLIFLVLQIRASIRAFYTWRIRTTARDTNFTAVPEIASRCVSVISPPSANPSHPHLPEQPSINSLFFVSQSCSGIYSASLLLFYISVQNFNVIISFFYSFLSYFMSNYSFIKQISSKSANQFAMPRKLPELPMPL